MHRSENDIVVIAVSEEELGDDTLTKISFKKYEINESKTKILVCSMR